MKSKKVTIYQLTFMAMMAAVTCILGPLSVPNWSDSNISY